MKAEEDLFEVGERIRRLRSQHGLTQRQLAEPRYTAAYVSSVEAGRRRPSTDALWHFAGQLGTDTEELLTGRSRRREVEQRLILTEAALALTADSGHTDEGVCAQAAERGPVPVRAWAHVVLGRAGLRDDDDTARALGHFTAAESLLRDSALPERVPAIAGQARCLLLGGDRGYATYLLETTLGELREAGLPHPGAIVLLRAGLVTPYLGRGAIEEAAAAASDALALLPRYSDPVRVARLYLETARGHLSAKRVEAANCLVADAAMVVDHMALRPQIAECHRALALRHSRNGHLDLAAQELETARRWFREAGDTGSTAAASAELSEVRQSLGELDAAQELLNEAMCLLPAPAPDRAGVPRPPAGPVRGHPLGPGTHGEVLRQAGRLAMSQGDLVLAEQRLREAADLFARADSPQDVAATMRLLGDLLLERGKPQDAAAAYESALDTITAYARRS